MLKRKVAAKRVGRAIGAGGAILDIKTIKDPIHIGLSRWPISRYTELSFTCESPYGKVHFEFEFSLGHPKTMDELKSALYSFLKSNKIMFDTWKDKDWPRKLLKNAAFFFQGYDENGKWSHAKALLDNPHYDDVPKDSLTFDTIVN